MITGYVGLIGHGKTMLAVHEARKVALRRGALLAANIKIDPPPGVEFRQLSVGEDGLSIEQMEQLMDEARETGRGVVILIDEIGIIMPARFWQNFPIALMYRISQSRKYATDLIYTSQDIEDVDAYLRRKTQWIYKVRCFPSPTPERRERGVRPWFFVRTQWRPATVDKKDKRIERSFIRYRRERETVYDTDELVRPPARLTTRGGRGRGSAAGRPGGVGHGSPGSPNDSLPGVKGKTAGFSGPESANGRPAQPAPLRGGGPEVLAEHDDTPGRNTAPTSEDRARSAARREDAGRAVPLRPTVAATGGRSPWEPLS